ncbi:MAG: hypothetical protein ABW185_21860 [Sedimenticola sp.]
MQINHNLIGGILFERLRCWQLDYYLCCAIPNRLFFLQQRRIDGHPVYEDNTSDSASNSDSSKELTSDDSDAEDWEAMDRTQFISDLLGRDKEKREQIANLSLADNSQQGKLFNLVTWMFYFIYTWKCINVISDNALNTLLSFLYHIFQLMSIQDKFIAAALHLFPASIYALRRMFNVDRDDFERMIVCPKCTALYKHTECFPIDSTVPHMLHCESVVNKTKKRTTRCKHSLFKKVLLKGGVEAYYPLKTYCYKPIIDSMELLLSRPGFAEICDHWKTRDILPGRLCDIYDGDVWQSFQTVGGHSFLSNPFSYGLQLNVDWFQPFTRRKDVSVGVIYIALLNLPLHLRFKRENIMIAGIIPNLDKEPSLHNFLEPLVAELQHLWKGVRMNVEARTTTKDVRAALLCCAADIPAARKLCGFLGHAATLGCSKCLKRFPGGFGVKKNYSGFNRENWPMRMYRDHLKTIKMLEKCKSKTSNGKWNHSLVGAIRL